MKETRLQNMYKGNICKILYGDHRDGLIVDIIRYISDSCHSTYKLVDVDTGFSRTGIDSTSWTPSGLQRDMHLRPQLDTFFV